MRRKHTGRTDTFPSARLYLEDIEEILEILSGAETITISDARHEYADLSDLLSHSEGRPRELQITTSAPLIDLHFKRGKSAITTPGESDEALHMYADVLSLLRARARRFAWLFQTPAVLIVALLFVGALLLLVPRESWDHPVRLDSPLASDQPLGPRGILILIGFGAVMAYVAVASSWKDGGYSRIELNRRRESISFWRRNQDKILLGALFGIGGWILGLLSAWVLKKLGISLS